MLEKQAWIAFAPALPVEWQQCRDEGLEVADFEEICRRLAVMPGVTRQAAEEVARAMHTQPVRADFICEEPSDLPGILAARPAERPVLPGADAARLADRVQGAWIGRIAGCLLGKPVEGFRRDRLLPLLKETGNYPLNRYIRRNDMPHGLIDRLGLDAASCWADNLNGLAPVDDDTNYTVFALKLLETYGPDFRANDVLEAWLQWIPMLATCTAERVAYRNAAAGLTAPETAVYNNPYREWIGAQIRGDLFGYVNPGNPEKAAALAFRDASISHVKNGIYGEMFVSAMIAAAAVCGDREMILDAGLGQIPANCRLRRDVERVRAWRREGLDAAVIIERIHERYDERREHDWCHTDSNAMIVTMALLCGEGDFGKSICLAVQAAFDTDCNGATVGSILGMMTGAAAIPAAWTEPFARGLRTSIDGFPEVTPAELAARTLALIE